MPEPRQGAGPRLGEGGGAPAPEIKRGPAVAGDAEATNSRQRAFRWSLDEGGLAEVVFDVPGRSVNTFTLPVMEDLEAVLEELAGEARIEAAVFTSGKEKGFSAGADLGEIESIQDPEEGRRKVVRGQRVFQRLATLPFPTLAVIHGPCLGGGLELALACRRRIAALDAELGLPEVNLGIIPAWGGTQRLARLIGPLAAVELICSAKRIDAKAALRLGLVDRLARSRELRPRVVAFARELALASGDGAVLTRGVRTRRPVKLALEAMLPGRRLAFGRARKRILARTKGHYPAPLAALKAIEEGIEGSLEAGLAMEARLASDLLVSPISKNLIHVFHLFEGVNRSPWAQAPPGERGLERAGVLGAGVMGSGIAQLLASAGLSVRLKDLDTTRLSDGLRAARKLFEERLRRGKLDRPALRRHMNLISATTDYSGFGRGHVVIEAIVEELEAKQRAFAELDDRMPPHALLCTNTSSLSISEIAARVRDRRRVAGLHFFNPVHRMPLVEIVRAAETSDETVGTLYRLALRLRKKPVVVRETPGFLVNRMLMPYLNEAVHLFGEGIEVEAIDQAATEFGMPVGPLALIDDIGLDVAASVGRVLQRAFPARMEPSPLFEALEGSGRVGRKGGRGFYLYQGSSRKRPDPSLRRVLGRAGAPVASEGGSPASAPADWRSPGRDASHPAAAEIEHRLVYPMINEAALCLAEGVVGSAAELDLAMLAGAGFPAFRGGLLRYADAVGVDGVVGVLERLAATAGPRLTPSAALREIGARGGFYAGRGWS